MNFMEARLKPGSRSLQIDHCNGKHDTRADDDGCSMRQSLNPHVVLPVEIQQHLPVVVH